MHVVLPGDIDDRTVPSGGNVYDRRVCEELVELGVSVRETAIPGGWPRPDPATRTKLARALAGFPDGAVVLLDGLVACGVPDVVVAHARRLRLVVLVHLPLADETGLAPALAAELDAAERRCLRAASAVVATSPWAARRLVHHHGLAERGVHTVTPGTDPAPLAPGTDGASRLLCVASVTPRKGHDLLVEALAAVADLPWSCECVGPLRRDPAHVTRLRRLIERHELGDRVRLVGPRTGDQLAGAYAAADLAVLPSRAETYGMVVTEALARGIPVLATAVCGVPETLGQAPGGGVPGLLVPPGDARALAVGLRRWLGDDDLRQDLRRLAWRRREALATWSESAREMAHVLATLRE
ncbi:glycosyl transferase [Longimycelium tulufanense]|uniref:Glycosyl transferase n=1 Tax=Longimycelium tulufanense TaxID=907463 RepID=A0A8J3CIX9_9PSEU|nr:glycosyltransferase family 4 protein [Longimycelium tulufanense]GGM83198.1 glycosyl transferase [Longimycelium tulufanense]